MDRSLPLLRMQGPERTCIWVDAGLLTFRLCDRDFACERCPLDAAIRGETRPSDTRAPDQCCTESVASWEFPGDRLYSSRHVWVEATTGGCVRVGLDACAARLLPPVRAIRSASCGTKLGPGSSVCEIDAVGGEVMVPSPVSGVVSIVNQDVLREPTRLASEPYGTGWIAEIALERSDEMLSLIHADAARELARLDARHLGRQAAFGLLTPASMAECWTDRGLLDATRHALGDEAYLSMVRCVLR